ncbi:MAG: pyridoxine 5'-phosphate synthase [Acidobacteria bacterium]|nr:pyridoxine 5'-phosphate synthase [Acidobacteriota bacterium]MCI0627378.1 pyridoxine 5'-phosphate synthase [Acidobacteriota bacterium]MCI0724084.1 pyridoxine 5'-phosphate synthase [Acidobacteriota bacterium]
MTKLGVNIDHIATLREARKTNEPDPVAAAVLAELAGCHGITVHLRSDRRHIQDRDVELLRETVKTRLNLEMAATEEMIRIAREVKPDTATLVPEFPGELTTQGGLDCVRNYDMISAAAQELEAAAIAVSLFIDPEKQQIEAAQRMGVPIIEINTASYADASLYLTLKTELTAAEALEEIKASAILAGSAGIRVHGGHGLTYRNVRAVSQIPEIEELNIGHNVISRAALVGLDRAVREMLALLQEE